MCPMSSRRDTAASYLVFSCAAITIVALVLHFVTSIPGVVLNGVGIAALCVIVGVTTWGPKRDDREQ